MSALRLFLKDKGGKQHCLIPFVGSNMGVQEKEWKLEKDALK